MRQLLKQASIATVVVCSILLVISLVEIDRLPLLANSLNAVMYREQIAACASEHDLQLESDATSTFFDINNDGTDDIIIHPTTGDHCGTAGCSMYMCVLSIRKN